MMKNILVSAGFDDLNSSHLRFLEEVSKSGKVHVCLWNDELVSKLIGPPKFPVAERYYYISSIKYVNSVSITGRLESPSVLPVTGSLRPDTWAVMQSEFSDEIKDYCVKNDIEYMAVPDELLRSFPAGDPDVIVKPKSGKKVLVTGCFDWFHSGHVRFLEEVSQYGDVYAVVGSDANVKLLKGPGHPMFSQDERRYFLQSVRFVTQALVSTGSGWLDAEPEILRIKPDIYAVNQDGDRPVKKQYCLDNNIEYLVLKRLPKEGLERRESTKLRGF